MTADHTPLTAKNTVKEWLDHPEGGAALREVLARGGQDAEALAPVLNLSLNDLAAVSQGRFPAELIESLVRQVNGGELPEEQDEAPAGAARFTGRTVIVTGAGSGIGRATAERIVAEGGRVVAVDIAADRLEDLAASQPEGTVVPVAADITDEAGVARIIEAAAGRIDGLANVAGVMDDFVPLHETSDQLWRRVFAVNVDGLFALSRAVLPVLLEAGRGSIVNVASEAGLRGSAAGTAYTASKHAVVGITRSAAVLYAPKGIRVNAVAPGPVATGIEANFVSEFATERLRPFLGLIPPVATAQQLAASITWLLSDDSSNVTGVILPSDGGWSVQ